MATSFLYQQQRSLSLAQIDRNPLHHNIFCQGDAYVTDNPLDLDGTAQECPALGSHHRHQALRPVGLGQPHQHGRAKPMETRRVLHSRCH